MLRRSRTLIFEIRSWEELLLNPFMEGRLDFDEFLKEGMIRKYIENGKYVINDGQFIVRDSEEEHIKGNELVTVHKRWGIFNGNWFVRKIQNDLFYVRRKDE